jgi:predicted acyltransferase
LSSLDQFRGYTVAGMLLVNFLSGFAVTPAVLGHHNTYCSYADTIMPQFFFAVGFAFRLTFGRRAATAGLGAAYRHVARRLFLLALVAIVFYSYLDWGGLWAGLNSKPYLETLHEAAKRTWFQTLMHIAVTSLWILPVIRASALTRIGYLIFSACAHVIVSYDFNLTWINTPPGAIDGGPLGFLTWCIPTLVGTLACDAVVGAGASGPRVMKLALWSVAIMLIGYALSCGTRLYDVARMGITSPGAVNMVLPPLDRSAKGGATSYLAELPFVAPPGKEARLENYWMMSQRYSSVSYQTFAAGFSLAVYLLFHLLCDFWGLGLGLFRTLGRNALTGYIIGILIQRQIKSRIPHSNENQAPAWEVALGFLLLLLCVYAILRVLEWRRIFVKL